MPVRGQNITLRDAGPEDLPFLYRVYAGTRTEELDQTGWDEAQKEAFLRMQFEAQHRHYHEHFREASYQIVEREGHPIGRLYLDRRPDEIRIIDIALLPRERRAGIGGALMREILDEAAAAGKPVRIHVERNNPAMRLYHRLGFRQIEDQGVYLFMQWNP
jgi:ribosomal protein S18 acetylase RimI-like enzyme